MAACLTCNLCDAAGTLSEATEVAQIRCNVRRFRDHLFTLWRCRNCNSLHCKEDADLRNYYAHYPITKQKLDFHMRVLFGNRLRFLKRQGFHSTQPLLEYGCGTGIFLRYLRAQGASNVTGYDAFVANYAGSRVLTQRYDVVVSYDVIEHAEQPRTFMSSVARLIRPGGLLIIGTPNADNLSLTNKHHPGLHPPYHRHILSERVLLDLGRDFDLFPEKICLRGYFNSPFPTVNWRFVRGYVEATGGLLDAGFESPRFDVIFRSPSLVFSAFLGALFPTHDNMLISFRKA
jgi:SAM-dependent methyltransferase